MCQTCLVSGDERHSGVKSERQLRVCGRSSVRGILVVMWREQFSSERREEAVVVDRLQQGLASRKRGSEDLLEHETKQGNVRSWNPIEKGMIHKDDNFASGHQMGPDDPRL